MDGNRRHKNAREGHAILVCLVYLLVIEWLWIIVYGMFRDYWYTSERVKSAYTWFAKLDGFFVGFSEMPNHVDNSTIVTVYFMIMEAH